MSFEDHSTHGPVSIVGILGKVCLNHPITLSSLPNNSTKDASFFLHCMALDRKEAQDLIDGLTAWLRLGE